jgi:hypothetical protein
MIINFNISRNRFSAKVAGALLLGGALSACGGGGGGVGGDSGASPVIIGSPIDSVPPPRLKLQFNVDQSRNNQGLAFGDGYYYVSYEVAGGKGYLERYNLSGVLDPEYGRVSVATGHSAEIAYRAADKRLYVVSGGSTAATYVYRMSADGKSVDRTYNFTNYGNSALLAIDNAKDLLVLSSTQAGGDQGWVTFRTIDWNNGNKIVSQFTIPPQGLPQGLEVHGDIVYFYTNNKITLLDKSGTILDEWKVVATGESEGIAVVNEGSENYLAVAYNSPRRVYSIRPIQLGTLPSAPANYVFQSE